jgi:transcriptional regulator ATRX
LGDDLSDSNVEEEPQSWIKNSGILQSEDRNNYALSYKLLFLIEIIKQCETVGDKLLVFSQSLESLDLIQRMLKRLAPTWFDDGHEALLKSPFEIWRWKIDQDFFLITGDVDSKKRDEIQKQFNNRQNPRNRVCLISTKAGSLGTNFVGANRVVIFDQNWNPSHDRQALFRAYRFGQVKPVYVYRLIAHGTIEDRIYARQVTKESISGRVVDEHQIERHFLNSDLAALYRFDVDEYDATKPPLYAVPEDNLLANVFLNLKEGIVNCLQHDSLLAHHEEEVLSPEEMKMAWEEYENKLKEIKTQNLQVGFKPASTLNADDTLDSIQ